MRFLRRGENAHVDAAESAVRRGDDLLAPGEVETSFARNAALNPERQPVRARAMLGQQVLRDPAREQARAQLRAAEAQLCLLTPDMQNRRIIDGLLRSAGGNPQPTLESNSMIVLFSHVRTGRWASVMPARLAETLGLTETIRAIPIVDPEATHMIGLVVPAREPKLAGFDTLNTWYYADAPKTVAPSGRISSWTVTRSTMLTAIPF